MRTVFTLLAGAGAVSAWSELLHQPIMHKNIDAIVEPGVYSSHMHTFFGSDIITNVMPTTEDLQQGCYSGLNANDLSAYCTWPSRFRWAFSCLATRESNPLTSVGRDPYPLPR